MLRGFVLRYLAAVAVGGDPAAARRGIPSPLRGLVERRARKHTIAVGFDSARADDMLHVASFVMDRDSWRMPEAYAAVALFEALADESGVEHTPLVVRRRVQRAQVSRIYGAVRGLSGAALSGLASRVWTALYGEPLAPIELEEG